VVGFIHKNTLEIKLHVSLFFHQVRERSLKQSWSLF